MPPALTQGCSWEPLRAFSRHSTRWQGLTGSSTARLCAVRTRSQPAIGSQLLGCSRAHATSPPHISSKLAAAGFAGLSRKEADEQRCFHSLFMRHTADPANPAAGAGDGAGRLIALDHMGTLVANLHGTESGAFHVAERAQYAPARQQCSVMTGRIAHHDLAEGLPTRHTAFAGRRSHCG